ncbi:hypothetical protein C7960_0399 [Methanohalophilus euhalobius]|uniref:Uncharacterized protein n=2 Tax=Methanohalophilus TaxID=2175 RepID=A0A285EPN1_9EURY|nr:hypothetical protein C7960_0399 [Methanohalophilus euhalobius]SNY01025.1 hypothetical protein SAMN06295989_101364 [Methanohalophilus euhalobius]
MIDNMKCIEKNEKVLKSQNGNPDLSHTIYRGRINGNLDNEEMDLYRFLIGGIEGK